MTTRITSIISTILHSFSMTFSDAITGDEQYYEDYMNELEVDKNRDIGLENLRAIGITAEEEGLISKICQARTASIPPK